MKPYITITDHKGQVFRYSKFQWKGAFWCMFLLGFLTGLLVAYNY